MKTKPKPCPHCGNCKSGMVFVTDECNEFRMFCGKCFALGPLAGNKEDALRYWNERAENR